MTALVFLAALIALGVLARRFEADLARLTEELAAAGMTWHDLKGRLERERPADRQPKERW